MKESVVLVNNRRISNTRLKNRLKNKEVDNMNKKGNKFKYWSDEEVSTLIKDFAHGVDDKQIADKIGRTTVAIQRKRSKLGLTINRWNNQDIKVIIQESANGKDVKTIADLLNKSVSSVESKINSLGLQDLKDDLKAII